MTQNGFRLFVVSLHDGQMRAEQPFSEAQARPDEDGVKPAPLDYRHQLVQDVKAHIGEPFNIGLPEDDAEVMAETGESIGSSTRLVGASRTQTSTRLWFSTGPILTDGLLIDPANQEGDIDMARRSSQFPFRASLVVSDGAQRGILIVEARGRSCPVSPLVRALRATNPLPWSVKVHKNVAARAVVQRFVRTGEVERVEFAEWGFDRDGRRTRRRTTLTSLVESEGKESTLKDQLMSWIARGRTRDANVVRDDAQAVRDAFYEIGLDINFNDVGIVVTNDGQQRTLKPSSDFERFTYVLGQRLVDDPTFFGQAEQEAEALLADIETVSADG